LSILFSLNFLKVLKHTSQKFRVKNYLLTGQKGTMRSDSEIKVSAKVLALNCITNILHMKPELFYLTLAHDTSTEEDDKDMQTVQDIMLYLSHNDPLLRGSVYVLLGSTLQSILQSSSDDFGAFRNDASKLVKTLQEVS